MFSNLTNALDFQSKGLVLRAERQRVIASNIANADTPGYAGRDINFKQAMGQALGESSDLRLSTSASQSKGSRSIQRMRSWMCEDGVVMRRIKTGSTRTSTANSARGQRSSSALGPIHPLSAAPHARLEQPGPA